MEHVEALLSALAQREHPFVSSNIHRDLIRYQLLIVLYI